MAGRLLFAITGLTLNHAGWFSARTSSQQQTVALPPALHAALQAVADTGEQPMPPAIAEWVRQMFGADQRQVAAEADADELELSQALVGGRAGPTNERGEARPT